MTKSEFAGMLHSMAKAWTNREYEKVAEFFTEQLFYSDPLHYSFTNKPDLLAFFQDDDGEVQFCEFHKTIFDEEEQIGAAEYTYQGSFLYHGTVWIEISNNKISNWREYQHKSKYSREDFWKGKF